jgi:hypothetical protein
VGNALSHAATGGDVAASSVTQAPTSHDNAVDTPAANRAIKNLGNTEGAWKAMCAPLPALAALPFMGVSTLKMMPDTP